MSEREYFWLGFGLGVVVCATLCLCFIHEHRESGRREVRHDAINKGYAEWRADGDGDPVFTWKEPQK